MGTKDEYYRIALPIEIKENIEEYIRLNPSLGYKSVPEFVKEILRKELKNIEDKKILKQRYLSHKQEIQEDLDEYDLD
jgi:hypothetical protein